ncbi:hypothetical protein FT662_05289 [Candidozyma haemuli var. vulneris]|nr:hypothetical protein FT662_05289 [[Candida] haemuloni var. vulneris]
MASEKLDKNQTASSRESLDKYQTQPTFPEKTNDASSDSDSASDVASTVAIKSFGIRQTEMVIEQVNGVWLKAIFYFTIFVAFYVKSVGSTVMNVFVGYATESYKQHSLMSTVGVIRGVAATASLPFFARLADTYGRLELLIISVVFEVVGIVIQSQATDVQKYAGGTAIQSFGHGGTMINFQVQLSDASSLRYRMLALGLVNAQTIINTWSTGDIVESLRGKYSWNFSVGMWAFIIPLAYSPFILFYAWLTWRASRTEPWSHLKQDRKAHFLEKVPQAAKYYSNQSSGEKLHAGFFKLAVLKGFYHVKLIFWYVDFIGCLLLAVILGLILVPLTLAGGVTSKWESGEIIGPLVLGVVLIPVFIFWETKITSRPMAPFKIMKNRGIWAALLLSVINNLARAIVNDYAYPVLLVGMNATPTVATRTPKLSSFTTALTIGFLGFVVSRVKRSKAFILFGVVAMFVASGLFVHFRGTNDGLRAKYYRDGVAIAMCITGFSSAFLERLVMVSAQSCTNHEYMAIVSACFSAFFKVGWTIGDSISGAIWTQRMYHEIENKMTDLGVTNTTLAKQAYQAPYVFAKQHKWGSPPRMAVSLAYAEVQKYLSITALCLTVPVLIFALLLRDHRLGDAQNLDDETLVDDEKHKSLADKTKTTVSFTNDKDYILIYLKKLVGMGEKTKN